jgi:predicted secreted Zn-dependent protease
MGSIAASLLVASVIAIAPLSAVAQPTVSATTGYYEIQGRSAAQLKKQMARRGPKGFWAYTTWHVRWTGDCRVSLEVSYTFPRWTNRDGASASLRQRWDRMITNLMLHERGHEQNGRNAAREIDGSRCAGDPMAIIRKWANQDKVYDKQTKHGVTQGAVLN